MAGSKKMSAVCPLFRGTRSFASKAGAAGAVGAVGATEASSSPIASTAFVNDARIPLMRYVIGDVPWKRFKEHRATTEERKKVIEALKTFLPRRPSQLVAIEAAREALDAQSILPVVQGRTREAAETPRETLDRIKPTVMEALGIEASQYDQVAEEILKAHAEEDSALTTENGEDKDGLLDGPQPALATLATLASNPTMSEAQRAAVSSIINEVTR